MPHRWQKREVNQVRPCPPTYTGNGEKLFGTAEGTVQRLFGPHLLHLLSQFLFYIFFLTLEGEDSTSFERMSCDSLLVQSLCQECWSTSGIHTAQMLAREAHTVPPARATRARLVAEVFAPRGSEPHGSSGAGHPLARLLARGLRGRRGDGGEGRSPERWKLQEGGGG